MDPIAEFIYEALGIGICPHENADSTVCLGFCTATDAREAAVAKYKGIFVTQQPNPES